MEEERTLIALRVVGLCFRQKEERKNRLVKIVRHKARISSDAHHFELTTGSRSSAEVLADRIVVPEKLPRKRFIDHCHFSRSRCILRSDASPPNDGISDDVKESGRHPIP